MTDELFTPSEKVFFISASLSCVIYSLSALLVCAGYNYYSGLFLLIGTAVFWYGIRTVE